MMSLVEFFDTYCWQINFALVVALILILHVHDVCTMKMEENLVSGGKVLVFTDDKPARYAEIKGITRLQMGIAKSVKIRFYRPDGEGDWEVGNGYQSRTVERRKGGIYLI